MLGLAVGINDENSMPLPTVMGTNDRVIKLNNAATTPPFEGTIRTVQTFLQTYGTLHRGAGPHATNTYLAVEDAIQAIRRFVHAREDQILLFTQNTSSAINLYARMLDLHRDDVVITSSIEHTSNYLPWRYNTIATIVEVNTFDDGSIDYDDLERRAKRHAQNLKLITMTGASNQTGYIPDIPRLAQIAHAHDAQLFIDAAQLVPHRPIDMQTQGIDALAFSAHKIYAPFGLGVLVVAKKLLDSIPVDPGGGSIDMISEHSILWSAAQTRHQTGTWNVTGIVALAESVRLMSAAGWDAISVHERELVRYTAERISNIPGIRLHIPAEKYTTEDRIGTFPFTITGFHHAHVAAMLEHEYGIETRAGTICNHRLVRRWFGVTDPEQRTIEQEIRNDNRLASYGIVRASLGIHNTKGDVDALADALTAIVTKGPQLRYRAVPEEETYVPW